MQFLLLTCGDCVLPTMSRNNTTVHIRVKSQDVFLLCHDESTVAVTCGVHTGAE